MKASAKSSRYNLDRFIDSLRYRQLWVILFIFLILCNEASTEVQKDRWINIGPTPIIDTLTTYSGRVSDVAVDHSNVSHWMVAAESGGIWETFDAGVNWTARTDDQPWLGIGAVALVPTDPKIIYAGSSSVAFFGDYYNGIGLYKSTDAGAHWQVIGESIFSGTSFSGLKISPENSDVVLAATTAGLFKSADGGKTWLKKLNNQISSLEVNQNNFTNQYAGISFANEAGVYRSTSAGESWAEVRGPWNALEIAFVILAISSSRPDTVYVNIIDQTNVGSHIWRSDNAWAATPTWSELPLNPFGQNFIAMSIDPKNPAVLYAGGISLLKFDGIGWTDITRNTHVDVHKIVWSGNRLIVGNDGGVFSTIDDGINWTSHNDKLSITQFYSGALHPTNPNFILAGSQDNGTSKWSGASSWKAITGADDSSVVISKSHPDTDWAISVNDSIVKTVDGSSFFLADAGIDKSTGTTFTSPLRSCPSNDDFFLTGTNTLWQTQDFFNSGVESPTWSANTQSLTFAITALDFAPSDITCNTYAFGGGAGQISLTTNGGRNWKEITIAPGLRRNPISIAFDPVDPNILYVAIGGYDKDSPDQQGHLFKTINALSVSPTWRNISPPIDVPHKTIVIDPANQNTLYVGTALGIWKSINGGDAWIHMGPETGMPNVPVNDIKINPATKRIIAFTYGRGAFILENPAANQLPNAAISATPSSGTAPLSIHFDGSASSDADGTISSYYWAFGDGLTGTGPIVDHMYNVPGDYTATLTVSDGIGGEGFAAVKILVSASAPAPSTPSEAGTGGGGGCSINQGRELDPSLPAFFATALAILVRKIIGRRRSA